MVDVMATVTSMPSYFMGTHTHAEHEEFSAQTASGPIEVIDNIDLAPRVPVQPGDRIEVCGEEVTDPGKSTPIVHWTHHDPAHHHPDGFIRFRGQVYA
jgi:hypothetical protein